MSSDVMRQQSSAFSALFLNRTMSKKGYLEKLMTSSMYDVKAAFPRVWRGTARKVSSISAYLGYLVGMVAEAEVATVR